MTQVAIKPLTGTPVVARLTGISRAFAGRPILNGIDLDIPAGQFVALLGASGSGKTTLLRLLAGLDVPDGGTLQVPAQRTTVFQEPRLMPAWPVWRNVVVGLHHAEATKSKALAALAEVHLAERADAWPATLSGGEAQRVALARALVCAPDLLLLDEPFAALDALTRGRMQTLVRQLCRRHHLATLLVTHDVEEAILLADRILILRQGAIHTDLDLRANGIDPANAADVATLKQQLIGTIMPQASLDIHGKEET